MADRMLFKMSGTYLALFVRPEESVARDSTAVRTPEGIQVQSTYLDNYGTECIEIETWYYDPNIPARHLQERIAKIKRELDQSLERASTILKKWDTHVH